MRGERGGPAVPGPPRNPDGPGERSGPGVPGPTRDPDGLGGPLERSARHSVVPFRTWDAGRPDSNSRPTTRWGGVPDRVRDAARRRGGIPDRVRDAARRGRRRMITWREEGLVLSVRRHGETTAIVETLTAAHGRHAGVVRGGVSRRIAPILQPGAQLDLTWTARLDDHIGAFTVEPVRSRAAGLMADGARLAGLNAVTALLLFALPEREAHADLYARTVALLDLMETDAPWPVAYLLWERALLDELGFGLSLDACAVTGATDGLAFVSPKTGRAVSAAGAGAYKSRLLPLSPALLGRSAETDDLMDGLRTTGHFLHRHLAPSLGDRPVPEARDRLLQRLQRRQG